ncbi:MAG: TonB-dependent receptor [Acidobacteriia bacterium]|nr:TonB-dependent receptor [Terriglobia bacterium]
MRHKSKWICDQVVRIPLVTMAIAVLLTSASGQLNQGSIAGNILDPSGAMVASVKVTAKNVATGATYETQSSSAGAYRFPNLNIGTYEVTASAPGFKTTHLTGVVVQVGTTSSLNITFQTGAVSEVMTVIADAPTIQTESAEVGTVVTPKQVLDLPLALGSVVQPMRSPEAFVFLAPGAIGPGTASGNGGTFESKINGGQAYSTEVLLDGASIYRSENGSSFDETAPSVDALAEFKLTTSTMPPEMGRTTGGVESFSTKAGTNSYHGSAYDIFRNEWLNANSFFANHNGFKRSLDRQNDYGLTLGGPVQIPYLYNGKDKTFFFFSWEQYRHVNGGISNITVPTALQRTGDFSETLNTSNVLGTNPCDDTPIYEGEVFDPATTDPVLHCRTAFMNEPGNIGRNAFPADYPLSAAGQNIMALYPNPRNGNLTQNFAFPWSYPVLDTTTTVRIDQNLSTSNKVYFTYSSRENHRTSTTPIFDNPAGAGRAQVFFTHYIRGGWDYSITPTMLNHLSVGYNRTNSLNVGAGVKSGVNWAEQLGISGTPPESGGTPFPNVGVFEGPLTGIGDEVYGDNIDNGIRFNDSVEHLTGKHDFKFGVDFRYQQNSPLAFGRTTGQYYFWRQQTAGTNLTTALSGNAIASLLLGQVHDSNLYDYSGQPRWLSKYYALFFQDSYKIRPNLTLSYGLRWDVDVPRHEAHGNTSNVDLTVPNTGADGFPGALVFAGKGEGRNGNTGQQWAETWYKDFGPRVGFAWTPGFANNKTVVRGGFGIVYGALLMADFGGYNRVGFTSTPGFTAVDGFNPAFNLDSGFPAYARPPNLSSTQLNYQGTPLTLPSFGRPAMTNNWSLEVQHELASDLIMDLAYVGQHSTHLHTNFDSVNSLHPEFLSLGTLLNATISSPEAIAAGIHKPYPSFPDGLLVAQALVPYPQYFGFNTDGTLENWGQSSYNSLQASLRRRFRNGLNLLASYSWTKTLTDADDALPFFATLHGGGSAQNPFNKRGEKVISNQDVPHTLVLSYVYELPLGKGKKFLNGGGVADRIVGGWSISGIHRYQSGQPLSFGANATGAPAFAGAFRFNRVPGQSLYSPQFLSGHFNPVTDPMFNAAAFTDPNIACRTSCSAYVFGDMPRTTGEVRMGHYLHEDFDILKRTRIAESTSLLFRISFLNAFNRHVFNRPPDLNPNDGSFGVLDTNNTLDPPRQIQLQLKLEF